MAHACCLFEPFSVFILEDNILHVSELILFSNKLSNCTGFSSDLSSVSSHPLRLSSERNSGAADKKHKNISRRYYGNGEIAEISSDTICLTETAFAHTLMGEMWKYS